MELATRQPLTTEIDTVAVVVRDRRKALAWYRDVLGLPVAFVTPDIGHWIELGPMRPRTRLHLCQLSPRSKIKPGGPTGVTLLTRDIRRAYRELRRRGVPFRSPPQHMPWGEWLCAFTDPDGNEFDLKQPVPASHWRMFPKAVLSGHGR